MGNPYSQILSHPGALAFSTTGLLARLPLAMTGLGIVLMIEHAYGSYALAGTVSAIYVVGMAAAAPVLANLVDKYGQARIMRPALATFNLGLGALVLATVLRAPTPALFAAAAIAGVATGSIGALVRARWAITVKDAGELHTAYALESALDEVVFVIGPVAATMLATMIAGPVAILTAMAFSLVGGFWFLSLRDTEPPAQLRTSRPHELWEEAVDPDALPTTDTHALAPTRAHVPARARPILYIPAMWCLIGVMLCVGVIFGATDVATVAFSKDLGYEAMAGVVLAIFAFGSLISGLIYGARVWGATLPVRLAVGVIGLAGGASLFLFIDSLTLLAAVMFATGFAIAPTFINTNAVVQQVVHPTRLTEGLTWMSTATAAGASLGSALAGVVIDARGGHAGFWVVVAGAAGAAVLVLATLPAIRRAISTAQL
ncbi:hypothetical protein BSZ39_00945 [Bowdeniella nasicola]|uniref:Major facilitator superfamily (MFS) profile domain-containing protein n=1 Tax=Bowdeniella nasicola TaxID=208480 RepID=A0A1Q5Q5K8_9ACTO|nr:MFS transporter [Bowdeniella nasicola]OKL54979.1 hypothetical protein BSZ39_00945 [Bowdeniella nasicola]